MLTKSDVKEGIILLSFVALLTEFLTAATISFAVVGTLLVWLRLRLSPLLRNGIALAVFLSYLLTYGKVIDPEVGLNFLTSVIVLKLLEKETERDRYMIFYGLILLVATGALFVKTLGFALFFTVTFFVLIQDFYRHLKLSMRFSDLAKALLWVMPVTLFFFFFIPRLMSPIPFNNSPVRVGEVGYSPGVNLTEVEGLTFNDKLVFVAQVDRELAPAQLYWRANTLTFSDGWNWPLTAPDRVDAQMLPTSTPRDGFRQKIRVEGDHEFFFGLDRPLSFSLDVGTLAVNERYTLAQQSGLRFHSYTVFSRPDGERKQELTDNKEYLRRSLRKPAVEWIKKTFIGNTAPELLMEVREYFQREGFSYSLSPGRVVSLLDFMTEKKTGFCSHYASALALILRVKGIPSRLVSGFMGGTYNPYAGVYSVTHNDAHAWVELYHLGEWQRVDPTQWVAPSRITLGGEVFMASTRTNSQIGRFFKVFAPLQKVMMWVEQWDFRFYSWLEEMDYHGQVALLRSLQMNKDLLIGLIPLALAIFLGLYTYGLRPRRQRSELLRIWDELKAKIPPTVGLHSLQAIDAWVLSLPEGRRERFSDVWSDIKKVSFAGEPIDLRHLRRRVRAL